MKWIGFLLLLSIIIETAVLTVPLTLIVVSLCSIIWGQEMILLVFIAGILLDLFSERPVGIDSLIFLLVMWIAVRYQEKISEGNIIYIIIFISAVTAVDLYIFYRYIDLWSLLSGVMIGSLLLGVISRFSKIKEGRGKRLIVG